MQHWQHYELSYPNPSILEPAQVGVGARRASEREEYGRKPALILAHWQGLTGPQRTQRRAAAACRANKSVRVSVSGVNQTVVHECMIPYLLVA